MRSHVRHANAGHRWLRSIFAVAMGAALLGTLSACVPLSASSPGPTPSPAEAEGNVASELLGAWTSDEAGTPRLKFDEGGLVSGSDGCNGISTQYTVDGGKAELQPFISTLKACLGVNDWLRGVRAVSVEGDTLHVFNAAGDEIGQLQREA